MEPLLLLSLLLGVISFVSIYFLRYSTYKSNPKSINSHEKFPPPPGKSGWPLVGETLDYISCIRKGTVDRFVSDRRKKYASEVFKTSLIGYPTAILCGAKGNKFLFTNESKLVQIWIPKSIRKIFPKSLEDPAINFMKVLKMFPALLKGPALQNYVGSIDEVMKQHLRTYGDCGLGVIGVQKITGDYTLAVACRCLLGIDDAGKYKEFMGRVSDTARGMLTMGINLPWTAFNRALKASKSLSKELEVMTKQRKIDLLEKGVGVSSSPPQDLLSKLLLATDENGQFFNESEIASHMVVFLMAGFDPLVATLTLTVKYMAEHLDVYRKVLGEQMEIAKSKDQNELLNWEDTSKMKYSWNVVKEVIRVLPPILGRFREATTDFVYAGHTIPKGTKLFWNTHSTHKDPDYFPNPEKFDPSRFDRNGAPPHAFVPFGGGPRMCPGNEYSKLVILVFLHNIVTKFRWELLIPNEKVVFNPHPKPVHGLPIRLHSHKP